VARIASIFRRRHSERAVLLAVALLAVAVLVSPIATAGSAGERLRPDLKTRKMRDLQVRPDGARQELRFTNEVTNRGPGVLQVDPQIETADTDDCDGDGDEENDQLAHQRLYRDGDGDGVFERKTESSYKSVLSGCMAFHPAHSHWHFNDFARYRLKRNSTGVNIAGSTKVSFCMVDNELRFPDAPGSPGDPYFASCDQDQTMGISVGWGDVYDAGLPDQDLDVTGLPEAWYCLLSTVDPDDRLRESDDGNNERGVKLWLAGDDVTVSKADCAEEALG
jgi:hypothetical protein